MSPGRKPYKGINFHWNMMHFVYKNRNVILENDTHIEYCVISYTLMVILLQLLKDIILLSFNDLFIHQIVPPMLLFTLGVCGKQAFHYVGGIILPNNLIYGNNKTNAATIPRTILISMTSQAS